MENPRCKIAAVKTDDPRCDGLLGGLAVGIEDARCANLSFNMRAEINDPRCMPLATQPEDPRCNGLLAQW